MSSDRLRMLAFSMVDPRTPGMLSELGGAFDGQPDLLPDLFDDQDPPTTPLVSMRVCLGEARSVLPPRGSVSRAGPCSDPDGWGSIDLVTNRSPEAQIAKPVRKGQPVRLWHSELAFSWDADYFSDDVRLDAVRSLFASVCESFRAFFGFVVADDAFTQFWKVFGGRQVAHANLGDVSWLNYYGPVTVARLGGIERFSALGVTRHVDAHGGIMIEAAPTPWYVRPDATGIEDYEFKQPFYETIGASAFAHGDGWEPHAEPPLPSAEDQYRGVPQTPDEDLG